MNIHARGTDPHEPLEAVLRAATAPGHPEELVGEHAAVAAFRTATVHAPRKRSFLARVLTVKALVAGSVAVSTGVVLAAVGGALPVPGLEPGNTPPAVINPVPTTTEPQQDRPTSTTEEPAGRSTNQPPSTQERCGDCRSGDTDRDNPGDDNPDDDNPDDDNRSGPGKKKNDQHEDEQPDPTTTDSTANDPQSPSSSRTQTPDSPAQGAATAVPPNGAEPPSQGG